MNFPNIEITPTGKSFPGDVPEWYADVSKIRNVGFFPEVPFEQGLLKTITWLLHTTSG
jgi:nucleoside-diphosphate-sugar epimerase